MVDLSIAMLVYQRVAIKSHLIVLIAEMPAVSCVIQRFQEIPSKVIRKNAPSMKHGNWKSPSHGGFNGKIIYIHIYIYIYIYIHIYI